MAVTARCFLGGQGSSAHFADFVPQEKKYVAFIAACPSQHDKLSRSNEEAISLSKEDVIEIEGIVREAMPNAIFKVEMLSEDKNTGKLTPSGHILLAHISGKLPVQGHPPQKGRVMVICQNPKHKQRQG